MRRALKIIGILIGILLLIAAVFAVMNWTLIRNIMGTKEAGVLDVEMFQPRLVVAGCDQGALPRYSGAAPIDAAVLDAMQRYSNEHGDIGLMVLVDGKVVYEHYRDGVGPDTRALSFSMHKSMMALVYGVAIEQGIIGSIDEPINTYLDEWADDPRGEIPIRAFLNMSSGLENPSFTTFTSMKLNFSDAVTKTALTLPAIHAPFDVFHYKGPDAQLAGAALNRALTAAGKGPYQKFVSEEIWCPIGAKDALLWPESKKGDPRFYAYFDASLSDWARVGQMILQDGMFGGAQVVPASWIEETATPAPTNPNYGLQTWIGSPHVPLRMYAPASEGGMASGVTHSAPYLADDVVFFDGFGGQRVYVVPSAGLVIVRSGDVSFTWDDAQLVNLALEGLDEGGR